METKPLSVSADINPIVLYYEDLQFLMTLFSSASERVTLSLKDKQNEYEFTTVEELSALKTLPTEKFNNLSITCRHPYLTLSLWKHGGEIHISEDTSILRGLMEKAKDRLKLRRRKFYWIYTPSWATVTLPLFSAYWGIWELTKKNYIGGATIALLSCVWFVLNYYSRFYNYTVVFSKTEKEHPSFFQRKRDDIYLAVISAIIGVIIGSAFTKWIAM